MTGTIITVATMKGGSGKSTLASCLAVHWHLTGRRPTLIDADPQRSIMRLAARERRLGGVHDQQRAFRVCESVEVGRRRASLTQFARHRRHVIEGDVEGRIERPAGLECGSHEGAR